MAPQIDRLIPPLITATGAATMLGCSRTWVTHLLHAGFLQSVRVGRLTAVAEDEVAALVKQRNRGVPGWRLNRPGPALPPLASTGDAARVLGYAQDNWPRALFMRGDLPGRQVGNDVVFRLQLLTQRARARALTSPRAPAKPVA